jgi:signal transduction histidine kinase
MISMPTWFMLTPAGLTSLTLLLLTLAFSSFLARRRPYSAAGRWLLGHEASLVLFLTAHLGVISTFHPAWYPLMYLAFVVGMACLLQFAGAFPQPLPNRHLMRGLRLLASLSVGSELLLALLFWLAPQNGNALILRTVGVGLGLWQILAAMAVLAYQATRLDITASGARSTVWTALLRPHAPAARAARNMLLAALAIASLAASNFAYRLWFQQVFSETIFNIAWVIGLMLMLTFFDLTYLVNTPDPVSFQVKLTLGTLAAVLTSVWLLSLIYPFQLEVMYDVTQRENMRVIQAELRQQASPAALHAEALPPAVAFVVACAEQQPVPLFIRETGLNLAQVCDDSYRPDGIYTQANSGTLYILQRFTRHEQVIFVGFSYIEYLETMNQFALPIALVMLGSALIIMLLLPLVFYQNLGKPLGGLLTGLRQVNPARLDVSLPVQANDEIGQIIQSFNSMAAELRVAVTNLENQIAESARAEKALREQREQLRALSARLAEVEEAERNKLGRELHDQAGQNLTALSLTLKVVRTQLTTNAPDPAALHQLAGRLDDASDLVRETTQRIRNVMEDLQPPALDEFGLTAALRWYTTRFSTRAGIVVEVSSPEPATRRPRAVELAFFRIAQEALTNVARHAQANRVEIQLELTDDTTRMVILDNGLGFDRRQPTAPLEGERSRWGLRIMAERARAIGGLCRVESAPGQGTQIVVEVKA